MNFVKLYKIVFVITLCMGAMSSANAQTTPVPDVTGLPLPLAAARLNEAGLALGAESIRLWSPALGIPQGTVAAQAVAPGTAVEAGSEIDLTVLRPANLVVLYDDNGLTLLNQGSSPINLTTLGFASLDGVSASFAASRWVPTLEPGGCVQVWSVPVNSSKPVDGCREMQYWLTTNNPGEHFWTAQGGTTQFSIMENGVLRAVCAVGPTGRCELYMGSGGVAEPGTDFVHFAYTQDWFVVRNTSDSQWMYLNDFPLFNYNVPQAGVGVPLADPTIYNYVNPVARFGQLAPGQCLLFRSSVALEANTQPPQCLVIAELTVDASVRFWGAQFELQSALDGMRRACPAATPARLTVCVMPR
jgi:hypothetical protein